MCVCVCVGVCVCVCVISCLESNYHAHNIMFEASTDNTISIATYMYTYNRGIMDLGHTCFASSLVGAITSTIGGRPLEFRTAPSSLSLSSNGSTNDRVFPVPVPVYKMKSHDYHMTYRKQINIKIVQNIKIELVHIMPPKQDYQSQMQHCKISPTITSYPQINVD